MSTPIHVPVETDWRGRRPVREAVAAVGLLPALRRVKRAWFRLADPRQLPELDGERVVFRRLEQLGELDGLADRRILEIGPKHGLDSSLLAGLHPSELVLVDLPEKTPLVRTWLPEVEALCPARHYEANLLYLSEPERDALGTFDLVWCLGVVYHNVEQLRLIRRLYDLCADAGRVVIESSTARGRWAREANIVQLHWPETFHGVPTVTHLPSRLALKTWLEMVGFVDVEISDVYSRGVGKNRAVLTGRKRADSRPYASYSANALNPAYRAGEAA